MGLVGGKSTTAAPPSIVDGLVLSGEKKSAAAVGLGVNFPDDLVITYFRIMQSPVLNLFGRPHFPPPQT